MKRFIVAVLSVLLSLALACSGVIAEGIIWQAGVRNKGVALLQDELISLGYLSGEADGIFGIDTAMAVTAFDRDRGGQGDSDVRASTIEALYESLHPGDALDVGSRGSAVYAIQQVLYTIGFLTDSPDGEFGENTRRAAHDYMLYYAGEMAEYMKESAPVSAGSAEPSTYSAGDMPVVVDERIYTAENVVTDGRVTADWLTFMLSGRASEGPVVQKGDTGAAVRRAQNRLLELGYLAAGADGIFGENTELAMKYFQHRNGIRETGICDGETRQRLYSDAAVASDQTVSRYAAYVSTKKNRVYIAKWTGSGYDELVKEFKCTTGASDTPTIKGTFHAVGQVGEWYEMKKSNCWVRYAFVIQGNYFFHSVLYSNKGDASPTKSSLKNLGRNASHGCIRLAVEDVQWIYENCSPGMTVVIA